MRLNHVFTGRSGKVRSAKLGQVGQVVQDRLGKVDRSGQFGQVKSGRSDAT